MATTSQLLTWAELECHGWNREGPRGSRALLNEAHRILMAHKTALNLLVDSSTGDFPYFDTQAGVYQYSCPANVWLVEAVLVDADTAADYGGMSWGYVSRQYQRLTVSGKNYLRLINMKSKPCVGSTAAWLQFHGIDPGDTEDYYRRMAYKNPVDITSDTIQHEMPSPLDVEYLLPATMKLIDSINDHTKLESARKYIETELKPLCWRETTQGEQGCAGVVTKRRF